MPQAGTDPGIRPRWFRHAHGAPALEPLDTRGGAVDAVLEQVWRLPRGESDFVTVVLPELFRSDSLREQWHHRLELLLKLRLLSEPGVVLADVPVIAGRNGHEPERLVVRVLVAGADAASMRAANYASTLGIEDTKAIHLAFTPADGARVRRDWADAGARIPIEVDDAPYRDLGKPLLQYVRGLGEDGDTTVLVIMPELITRGWRRLLHNQRALYIKRLLLFEPDVILASVPYQVMR